MPMAVFRVASSSTSLAGFFLSARSESTSINNVVRLAMCSSSTLSPRLLHRISLSTVFGGRISTGLIPT